MTLFLISLPVFISCLMIFASLLFCIRNHDLSQSICFKHTLQVQEQMKEALQKLLKLNPIADQLRYTQKYLEKLYYAALQAGEPISIITLRKKIQIIKQKRNLLNKKQKNILHNTVRYIESTFYSFKKQMVRFHPRYIQKAHHQPFPLAVVGKPKGDIAPSYYPAFRFTAKQTVSFSWKMPLYRFLPKWLESAFFQTQLSSYNCAATLKKKGPGWKTTLTSPFYSRL